MMKELAEELHIRGYEVTVITSWPAHNIAENTDISFGTVSVENGVTVIRVKALPQYKYGYLFRGISQLTLHYFYYRKVINHIKGRIDFVIVYSPPLPLVLLGRKIKKIYGAKFLLNIQDVFPQNAIDLGIIKNKILINFYSWVEKKGYSSADKITSHTDNSRNFLIREKGIPPEKILSVYNWIDIDRASNIKQTGGFREKYGLKNKFILLFAGVMGPSQNLDFVIQVAVNISSIQDICFLLVGGGTEKKKLQRMVEEYKLQNVRFLPFMSNAEYSSLVKEVDVGFACLSMKNRTPVIPGKILSFMAASIPVIAFLNKESDGHILIREAKCGYSILSDNEKDAAGLVAKVYNEKEQLSQYGKNGYQYVVDNFSKEKCISKLEKVLQEM